MDPAADNRGPGDPTNSPTRGNKIVCDPVHGIIHLDELAVKIIDTRYFQRLRYIKQLSFVDYVYPGATHTRFSHSIGAYHLACKLIESIKGNLPKGAGKMTSEDEMCVRVAALCRGIGHGPFGHAYARIGKKIANMDITPLEISAELTEIMLRDKDYELEKKLGHDNITQEQCIRRIKDLIKGKRDSSMSAGEKKKKYMFQIVTNLEGGLHVGEWDYYNRDAIACGVSDRFQYDRALSVARVVQIVGTNEFVLGYRDYDALFLYNMFHTRFTLYQKVYRHRVVVAVELMIKDVFKIVVKASNNGPSQTRGGGNIDLFPIKTNEDLQNKEKVENFLNLGDNILFKIRDHYPKAKDLIQKIQERKVYKMIKDINITSQDVEDSKIKETRNHLQNVLRKLSIRKKVDDEEVIFNYGCNSEDPVHKLYFYSKEDVGKGKRLEQALPCVRPSVFEERYLRVYYKPKKDDTSETTAKMKARFEQLWDTLNKDKKAKRKLPSEYHSSKKPRTAKT